MISDGRYAYHLDDIVEIEAKPKPLSPGDQLHLDTMRAEVAEYEAAYPDKVKVQPSEQNKPTATTEPKLCEHGNPHYCGFCGTV